MNARRLAYLQQRAERLVAHRELQLARAYARGDGRYIAIRQHKLRRAQVTLRAARDLREEAR